MSGFSEDGMRRLHRVLERHVDSGYVPGLVALASRGDETHVEVMGTMEQGTDRPMRRNTIFRVASTTKPITAAAVLILLEECRLRLDDPLSDLLPELDGAPVLKDPAGSLDDVEPRARPITTRDLLTFGCGYGFDFAHWESPLMLKMQELGVAPGSNPPPIGYDEWLERLGTLPFGHQPGQGWMYNHGLDLAGIVIARATGGSFGDFLRDRLFEPLGMRDTAFSVPAEKLDRFGPQYGPAPDRQSLVVADGVPGAFTEPPTFEAGGGGLVSTVDDLHAFHRMLLLGGRAPAGRILSRSAVELMRTDQLGPGQGRPLGPDLGWAFGGCVVLRKTAIGESVGRYGWEGGSGTYAYADPTVGLIDILLTQRYMDGPSPRPDMLDLRTAVYASLDD